MATARRVGKWALYAFGGCAALVIVLRVGIGIYLSTSPGKAMVARQVEQLIGMPAEVTHVRLGLMTSSISMKLFDPAAPKPANAEVLAVEDADADVSLFNLATGNIAPEKVTLHGVKITLHVSRDGKVITTLPTVPEGKGGGGAIPTIELTGGQVSISQEGRPEFTLEGLNLTAAPAGGAVKLSGTIDDPRWSKWTVSGTISQQSGVGEVVLKSDDAPLTMDRLTSIPFVPEEVWQHVRADGRGAATLRLWTDSAADVHYSVGVTPRGAELTSPDANVTLTNLTGQINVTGTKLMVEDARAELAGGTIGVTGETDFGPEPTVVKLHVVADKLATRQLPAEWNLPREFQGKLQGHADLVLKIYDDGRIEPEGNGDGKITEVTAFDLPADDIPLRLRHEGGHYEFHQPKSESPKSGTGRARPKREPVACAAPPQEKQPTEPPKKESTPKKDEPTTLDATIRLRDVDIAQLLEKLKVKLDYKIQGKATAEVSVAVAVGGVLHSGAYRFTGKITSPALTFEGLTIRDLAAHMAYQDGTFTLSELSGKVDQPGDSTLPPGEFKGTFTAATDPPGDVTASLTIDRIPVAQVLKALPGFTVDVKGTVAGKVSAKAPYDKASDPGSWTGSGELTSTVLVVEGRSIKDVAFSAVVEKGTLSLKQAKLSLEGIPITTDGTLGLSGNYPFTATVRTTGTDVTDLRKLVPEVEIPAPVEGVLETETKVTGTASPFTLTANGTVTASKLTLAKSTANRIAAKWELTTEKLVVSEFKADVFGGTVSASANVPFAADKSGAFEVNFKGVDASGAAELVPDFPVKIAGKVSGRVAGAIAPAKEGQSRVGNLDVDLTAPKLTVQGIPAERLTGKATIRNQAVEYSLEGKALGGSFDVKGSYPGQKKNPMPGAGGAPPRGSFKATGIDLSRIAPAVGFTSLAPLRGRVDANFDFENDFSAGSGRIRLTRLGWAESQISEELTADLILSDGVIRLGNVSGRVAGGQLRARGQVRLNDTSRNFFSLSLDGADAQTLLAPFLPAEELVKGRVSILVHGRIGSETRGSGTIALPRGTVSGVEVSDLRVPFEFASAPGGYGRFSVREASVRAGSGRATAELTLDWGYAMRVEGKIRFQEVPLRTLAPQLGENALLGNGTITGRFDIEGSRVRSADDLKGRLVATLNNTSVKEVPILQQVTPFLNPSGLVKPFQSGDIQATLDRGFFRVQRLALASSAAQLFAEGTISTAGRVDLNVVAHTGTIGPEARGLRLFGLRLPAVGPVPLTLIRDVSDFLSNRTVRLTITGNVDNPIVRVNVGALLTEQAIRFLLTRYVLPAEAAGALGYSAFGSNK